MPYTFTTFSKLCSDYEKSLWRWKDKAQHQPNEYFGYLMAGPTYFLLYETNMGTPTKVYEKYHDRHKNMKADLITIHTHPGSSAPPSSTDILSALESEQKYSLVATQQGLWLHTVDLATLDGHPKSLEYYDEVYVNAGEEWYDIMNCGNRATQRLRLLIKNYINQVENDYWFVKLEFIPWGDFDFGTLYIDELFDD